MRLTYRTVVRRRSEILFFLFVAAYALVALRLTYVQYWKADRYEAFGKEIRNRRLDIVAQRGVIYDRVGRELAMNLRGSSVYAHPRSVRNIDQVSFHLASLLGCEQDTLAQKLAVDKSFVWLKRGASDDIGEKICDAELPGVYATKEQKRIYPSGVDPSGSLTPSSVAAQVVGFTDVDGKGRQGVEKVADRYLKGANGFVAAEVDKDGRIIPETRRKTVKAHDGLDVVLTIDAYIQHVAEEALRKTFEASKALGACAIVMDPETGEILAMANMPTFNSNGLTGSSADQWRNRAVTDLYEPGSTLKTITAAAALEEGIIDSHSIFAHCSGSIAVGRRRVRCVLHHPFNNGHAAVDLTKMIQYSCNIGASELGMKLRADRLYKYEKAFGLLSKPRSGLPGEVTGRLDRPSAWPTIKCANVAFGQGIAITPLQITCAYSVIANGGVMMRPMIIRELRSKDGSVCREFSPKMVRRVVSDSTAAQVKRALVACVADGTGKSAQVEGYSIGGKTGSAQKVRKDGRGYEPGKYVASFIGFLPASNPRLVILVMVDEPKGTHWGATVAAPAFKDIATKAMWYLRTPRDQVPTQPNTRVARKTVSA
ncbi:MAG: penicillin-binding transpeptidase domain-containing protein [Armatimonadota bacterium]|nr:penicillin-binding transpeptidase domain-containing protein [Armatimonadota bacterium]